MGKFVFKFDKIYKVKVILEKKIQKEIAELDLMIVSLEEKISSLREARKSLAFFDGQFTISAGYAQYKTRQEELLDNEIDTVLLEKRKVLERKEKKILELQEKAKERKIFEKLEEQYKSNFEYEQLMVEQKLIDETATAKFIRGNV